MKFTLDQLRGMRARMGTQVSFAEYLGLSVVTVARYETGEHPAPGWYHYATIGAAAELGLVRTTVPPAWALAGGVKSLRKRVGSMRPIATAFGIEPRTGYVRDNGKAVRGHEWYRLAVLAIAIEQGHLGLAEPNPYEFARLSDGYVRRNGAAKQKEPDLCGRALKGTLETPLDKEEPACAPSISQAS